MRAAKGVLFTIILPLTGWLLNVPANAMAEEASSYEDVFSDDLGEDGYSGNTNSEDEYYEDDFSWEDYYSEGNFSEDSDSEDYVSEEPASGENDSENAADKKTDTEDAASDDLNSYNETVPYSYFNQSEIQWGWELFPDVYPSGDYRFSPFAYHGYWYVTTEDGSRVYKDPYGPVYIEGKVNYFAQGEIGFHKDDDGKWRYWDKNGNTLTGWLTEDGHTFYLGSDGAVQTGWTQVDGKTYYMNDYGYMLTGTQTIDGKTYDFGSNGVLRGEVTEEKSSAPAQNAVPGRTQGRRTPTGNRTTESGNSSDREEKTQTPTDDEKTKEREEGRNFLSDLLISLLKMFGYNG